MIKYSYDNNLVRVWTIDFIDVKQDISDIQDIDKFYCEESLNNHSQGKKGFIASFASKKTDTQKIISGIKNKTLENTKIYILIFILKRFINYLSFACGLLNNCSLSIFWEPF